MAFKIRLEGWKFLPHSYSLVFCAHAAELARRAGLELCMLEAPHSETMRWDKQEALPWPDDEALIRSIPWYMTEGRPDAIYRVTLPLTFFDRGATGRTVVHVSCDSQAIPDGMVADSQPFATACQAHNTHIVTPSTWSRDGLLRAGAAADRLHIVPHGVDARLFKPTTDAERQAQRQAMRLPEDAFVFLSVSSMVRRKGVDVLLAAFRQVWEKHPEAILVLKGTDGLHRSRYRFEGLMRQASAGQDRPRWTKSVVYSGQTMSTYQVAQLYKAADCYVTPYRAEAFNLPALQAVAAGVPLIATAGGPTDDFMPANSFRVASSEVDDIEIAGGLCLEPDLGELVATMLAAIQAGAPMRTAAAAYAGPLAVQWSWAHATDRLLEVLQP